MKYKIAIVLQGFPQISETFIINHIKGLIEFGHDVTIFSNKLVESKFHHPIIKENNLLQYALFSPNKPNGIVRIIKLFVTLIRNLKTHSILIKTLNPFSYGFYGLKGYLFYDLEPFATNKNKKFDIIYTHFGDNGYKVIVAKKLKLIFGKHIVHFHGHDLTNNNVIKSQGNYSELFNNLDGIVFNSIFLKNIFNQKFVNSRIPFKIIHEPLDTSKFENNQNRNFSNGIFNLITVGRLVSWKGQREVIEAIKVVKKNNSDISIHYHIVGDGEDYNFLKEFIVENDFTEIVTLHGSKKQDEISILLEQSDVFILFGITNSLGEIDTQGVVVQEASASKLPVIVSDAGGIKEGVIDNVTGMIVPEGDVEKLAQAIVYLYHNPIVRQNFGNNGLAYVKNKFDYKIICKEIVNFYSEILEVL